jgi:hypothetical protein
MSRDGNPRWEGGISDDSRPIEWNPALKKKIRLRDKFICVKCGWKGLHVHHIDKDKNNCDEANLITMCESCHLKFHAQHQGRKHRKKTQEEWKETFWNWVGMRFEKVESAKTEAKEATVYSIEVEKNHNFVANNFMTHNTIVDESAEIDDESYAKIYRMLVESEDAKLVEIGNPWTLGHFYAHHNDPDWERIHISWQDCVEAGRMTPEAVKDQRENLTDLEFQVLFDANFPDEVEMAVFTKEAIANCTMPTERLAEYDKYLIGVDVARGGRDRTVITLGGLKGRTVHYLQNQVMDTRDIMTVAGSTALMATDLPKPAMIAVDCVGNGAGVHDRLRELNYNVYEFMAGRKSNDPRYYNLKTEIAFRMNEMMKAGNLKNVPAASPYSVQLRAWTYEVRSDRQLKIVDPEAKSPDHGDSLMIMAFLEIYYGMTESRTATRGL